MPVNEYYDSSGAPAQGSFGSSSTIRGELNLVEEGFNKLPVLAGNGDKLIAVNAGATAMVPKTAAEARTLISAVQANAAITGDTKTKITYDAKGLVTAGTNATTADVAATTDKNYVNDAQLTVIGNTSGTNTGDQLVFKNIAVAGQDLVVADSSTDTLTLAAGTNITLTTNAATDTLTIAAASGGGSGNIAYSWFILGT